MAKKTFHRQADQFREVAPNRGYCFATDMITVDGLRVGYMYREPPNEAADSGWRFFSGQESQDYIDSEGTVELYDVNTIANYDPEIVPWLDAVYPIAFERNADGHFVEIPMPEDIPD